jgi:hypothetical protein
MQTKIHTAKCLMFGLAFFPCILSGVCFLLPAKGEAQEVEIEVGEVTDTRTTGEFFSGCEVTLKIEGDAVSNSLGIRATRLHMAVDDTGQNLIKDTNSSPSFFDSSSEKEDTLQERIKLKNPSRNAKAIKSLEGELEIFQPTIDNEGMVIIEDFMSHPSEPISSSTLDKWHVQVTYLTKESYILKKKEFEERNKEGLKKAAERYGGTFAEMFDDFFEESLSDEKNTLQFYVKDPDKRVIDLAFIDNMGNPVEVWRRSSMGELRTYTFKKTIPPPDTKLVIYLATPDSIKIVPFKLNDIALP